MTDSTSSKERDTREAQRILSRLQDRLHWSDDALKRWWPRIVASHDFTDLKLDTKTPATLTRLRELLRRHGLWRPRLPPDFTPEIQHRQQSFIRHLHQSFQTQRSPHFII